MNLDVEKLISCQTFVRGSSIQSCCLSVGNPTGFCNLHDYIRQIKQELLEQKCIVHRLINENLCLSRLLNEQKQKLRDTATLLECCEQCKKVLKDNYELSIAEEKKSLKEAEQRLSKANQQIKFLERMAKVDDLPLFQVVGTLPGA